MDLRRLHRRLPNNLLTIVTVPPNPLASRSNNNSIRRRPIEINPVEEEVVDVDSLLREDEEAVDSSRLPDEEKLQSDEDSNLPTDNALRVDVVVALLPELPPQRAVDKEVENHQARRLLVARDPPSWPCRRPRSIKAWMRRNGNCQKSNLVVPRRMKRVVRKKRLTDNPFPK